MNFAQVSDSGVENVAVERILGAWCIFGVENVALGRPIATNVIISFIFQKSLVPHGAVLSFVF